MKTRVHAAAALLVLACSLPFASLAQTTAGTSTVIVVPVVAHTASFESEVTVFNPNAEAITIDVSYYDANNTATPGPKPCTPLSVGANRTVGFQMATQCTMGTGNHFGLLVLSEASDTLEFMAYTRTETPQGRGFSTEGFPLEQLNDTTQHATGLKRLAAAGDLPAYQTNCFAATLGSAVDYELRLFDGATAVQLGSTVSGSLAANQQIRYLDIFGLSGVNAPPGDYTNIRAEFTNLTSGGAKLIGFCTVQENQTFAADFRIGKGFTASVIVGGVNSVVAGTGLEGGGTGPTVTLSIASGYRLPQGCTTNQIPKWNGSAWQCAADASGGGTGTVTSVGAGTGLTATPNPITTTGTISVASGGIGIAQLADHAVTQAKLSPTTGGTSGKVLGTDGTNLVWQTVSGGGGVAAVTASPPLASSGGSAPNISLAEAVPAGSGGTGRTTLAANGVLYGQGTAAVGTAIGTSGQVLAGTAGAPAWTDSPALGGNLVLAASVASAGNIMKGSVPFIHNFGTDNTFVGANAGNLTMSGAEGDTVVGAWALHANTTGYMNTAHGTQALFSNTTGNYNTASGAGALFSNVSGEWNTAVGMNALMSLTKGVGNIAIGGQEAMLLTEGDNNIYIGSAARSAAIESNTIRIGTDQSRTFVGGIRGVATGAPDAIPVVIDSMGQLGTVSGFPGGGVTSVTAGPGLTATPNPITGTGVIGVASSGVTAAMLASNGCTNGQLLKWNSGGGTWSCSNDNDSNSGGTVTSVYAGTGLTTNVGGPITTSGAMSIQAGGVTSTELATNAVTGVKIASLAVTNSKIADLAVTMEKIANGAVTFAKIDSYGCSANQVLKWSGASWNCGDDNTGAANAFVEGGNAFGTLPGGTAKLGTTTYHPLDVVVYGNRALQLRAGPSSPNLIGGHADNVVVTSVSGQTIAGGGMPGGSTCFEQSTGAMTRACANQSHGEYSAIGGGFSNSTYDHATVSGGFGNTAQGSGGTVGGGSYNRAGASATVAGGAQNVAANVAAVGGGAQNEAVGQYSVVDGGQGNKATYQYASIGGGKNNVAQAERATIGGGEENTVGTGESGYHSTIGGGRNNATSANFATVGGGEFNTASGYRSTVGGGYGNVANMQSANVGGGESNHAAAEFSTVSGGYNNLIDGDYSVVGGGQTNRANGARSTVGGGLSNTTWGNFSTVAGGTSNTVEGAAGVVGGGSGNSVVADSATVAGGSSNTAGEAGSLSEYATVGGGYKNVAGGQAAVIGGGEENSAGSYATVSGGLKNGASFWGTVCGGEQNLARGNYATACGGYQNVAYGKGSFAAGHRAKDHLPGENWGFDGTFVWADSQTYDFNATAENEFAARATGGVRFVTAINVAGMPTAGVAVAAGGGTWSSLSDRFAKRDLADVDPQAVLSKLMAIPVYTWRYSTEASGALHMGPTAQDFRSAFGLGDSDKTITTIDEGGVALAAIQGLHHLVQKKDAQIAAQQQRIADLEDRMAQVESLRGELAALRQTLAELLTAKEGVAARGRAD